MIERNHTAGPSMAAGLSAGSLRGASVAWVMLDWGASAFSTISITLLVAYVEKVVFAGDPWGVPGGVVWAWTLAVAMLLAAVVAPWVAAWADRTQAHRQALLASVLLGSIAAIGLALVPPSARLAVVAATILASIGFDLSAIFTGSLLPRIAVGKKADRLSAIGYAAGYAGGAIALVIATGVFSSRAASGLSDSGALRVAFAIMGGWWLLFSLPAFFVRFGDGRQEGHSATSAGELLGFARELAARDGCHRALARVLTGAVLLLGAMQTAIGQFSSVALQEFHLEAGDLVRLVLLVQVVALPGALVSGWLSTVWGRWPALVLSLSGWVTVLALAGFVSQRWQLTALAVLLGVVLGGAASVLRATVAGLAPPGRFGATFGLLNVGSKLAGFLASVVFGGAYALTGHPRAGLVALLVQLVAGWWFLARAGTLLSPLGHGEAGPTTGIKDGER